jgi:hypothetical protein
MAISKKRSDGRSLADIGYVSAGLDDAWQACGIGGGWLLPQRAWHSARKQDHLPRPERHGFQGHALGLKVGFYINNCICGENQWRGNSTWEPVIYEGTVKAIMGWDFDGTVLV